MVSVSAVISAHNEEEYIAGCLESILAQTMSLEEVLVVDDRSTDRTSDIASLYPVDVYEVQYGQTYMTKRAGIFTARNNIILCVDGDTELAPDFLERGLRHLGAGYDVASGKLFSRNREITGDLTAWVCNVLPKTFYASGPGYVIDRSAFMDTCIVERAGTFVDVCESCSEIPLQRFNLVRDPDMKMWTELPSTGQRRMINGARVAMGAITALRVLL